MWWEHPLVLGVGGAAVLIAGISTIWGKGIVPTTRAIKRFFHALTRFAASVDVLFDIADQFKPNGGNSLFDRIKRIEDNQTTTHTDISEIKRQLENVITQELPQLSLLTEIIVAEQEKVARDLNHTTHPDDIEGAPV